MWTLKREDGYEIDNIPFYVKELALGDVVSARAEADGTLWFSELVRSSGHSIIQLWFSDEHDVQPIRDELRRMGCASEVSDLPRLVTVDVPSGVSYAKVKELLDREEQAGTFEYQEACLGFMAHRDDDGSLDQEGINTQGACRPVSREVAAFFCAHIFENSRPVLLVARE